MRPAQAAVAGVAQQRMAVGVARTGQAVGDRAAHERPGDHPLDAGLGIFDAERGERVHWKAPPGDRSVARHVADGRRQVVELASVDGLHRGRQVDGARRPRQAPAAVDRLERADADPRPKKLLDEERVAVGALFDGGHKHGWQRLTDELRHESRGVSRRQWMQFEPLQGSVQALQDRRPRRGQDESP